MESITRSVQRQQPASAQEARQPQPAQGQETAPSNVTPLIPAVDIIEAADGITLLADMPGVPKERLSISLEGDTLAIEGGVDLSESARLQNVYAEVRVAQYRRSFVLSRDLDSDRIDAKLQNGVLTLHIPKREQAKPKRIEIKS
jgi:HSP20 family molecular chaperone IbpA